MELFKNEGSLVKYLREKSDVYRHGGIGNCRERYISYVNKKGSDIKDCYPHLETLAIYGLNPDYNSTPLEILVKNTDKMLYHNQVCVGYQHCGYADDAVLLFHIFHTRQAEWYLAKEQEPQNSQVSLLKLHLSHNSRENDKRVCDMLQQKVKQYSKLYNVAQDNIKLSLTRLFGFERLKFNSDEFEKYIQFKNEKLSNCTEEALNEQAEKFINPHNYPDHFKNEIYTCLGAETAKQVEGGIYSKVVDSALDTFNPDSSLQTLQVSALIAIGKSVKR